MKKYIIALTVLLISIQFIPIDKINPPIDESTNLKASKEVLEILKRSCYDCHSNETTWPTYSSIAPISWQVAANVKNGRKALNFSNYSNIDKEIKTKRLERAIKTINNGLMPPPDYILLHKEAILSDEDKKIIVDWFKKELKR